MKLTSRTKRLVVDSEESCTRLLERLSGVEAAAADTETDDKPNRAEARAVSLQLFWGDEEVFISERYLPRLKPWFEDEPTLALYGAKSDMWWLENINLPIKGPVHDVMVLDYLVNENVKAGGEFEESLKDRHAKVFDHEPRLGYKKMFTPPGKAQKTPGADVLYANPETRPILIDYGCADARETWELYVERRDKLTHKPWTGDLSMLDYFERVDAPYTRVLYEVERRGVYIDTAFLEEMHEVATAAMESAERRFYMKARELAGDLKALKFTDTLIGSPKQLGRLFYDVIGYPEQFKIDKKHGKRERKRTSDSDALENLAAEGHELPVILDEWRKINKIDGTYLVGMLEKIHNHRLHTEFQQAFTLTGRLSSRNPNLQNIPRPDQEWCLDGVKVIDPFPIRHAFCPTPGLHMLSLDYSQIEVRIAAHMSGDEDMIAACMQSDIYVAMAKILFPRPDEFWAKPKEGPAGHLRQVVKAIVLGLLFGKQAKSIAVDIGITQSEAQNFMNQFFAKFRRLAAFMKNQIRKCRERGFVRTLHGRYRHIPDIQLDRTQDNWGIIAHAERQTLNSPIQGSAFDIMKKAMLNIHGSGIEQKYGIYVILSVHDELLFEGKKRDLEEALPHIKEMMMHPFEKDLKVALPVAGKIGLSWGEIH